MERDKLLGTMDAKVWTDEFMATKARLGNKEFDHAMMLSWFANAIMAGFDEANRCAQRALDAERKKVKELECYRALWKRRDDELTGVLAQLATLQARVKELERDNAAMKQLFNENPSALWGQLATLQAQLKWIRETDMQTLRAENARLREALQLIVHGTQDEAPPWRCLGVTQMQVIARDALQPERGEP